MQWIGNGVLTIEGKDYGYGEVIPEDALTDERIEHFKKVGKIGTIPIAGPEPKIAELTANLEGAIAQNKALDRAKGALEDKNVELIKINSALNAELAALKLAGKADKESSPDADKESSPDLPPPDSDAPAEGAGPKKGGKAK